MMTNECVTLFGKKDIVVIVLVLFSQVDLSPVVLKECFIPLSPVKFDSAFLDAVEEDVASPSSKPVVCTAAPQRKKVSYSLNIFAG